MDYSALIQRSWEIIWKHKWLILLGVLVALGSGAGGGGGGGGMQGGFPFDNGNLNTNDNVDFTPPDVSPEELAGLSALAGLGIGVAITLGCVLFLIGIAAGVISRIATGALIAGVDTIENGGESTFGQAWRAGWARGWTLIGNSLVAALPGFALVLILLVLIGTTVGFGASLDRAAIMSAFGGMAILVIVLACLFIPIFIIFSLLLIFADRAAMLEGLGVFASYSRAWEVLRANIGQVLVLVLVQIVLSICIGLLLVGPSGAILVCFCLLWPLLWLINGAIQAYFSTLWTLAYRQLIGRGSTPTSGPAADVAPPAPAV